MGSFVKLLRSEKSAMGALVGDLSQFSYGAVIHGGGLAVLDA